MEDAVGRNAVEAPICERQLLGITRDNVSVESEGIEVRARELDVARRQVESRDTRSPARVSDQVDALAAADVEEVETGDES